MQRSAVVAAGTAALAGCDKQEEPAPAGKLGGDAAVLRVGLVGCGGRGTGAAENCLRSAAGVELVALADMFPERLDKCRRVLSAEKLPGYKVEDSRCFTGFDAYKKLLDSGVDYVLLCTPPGFRPLHFAAAVAAGKHVFMEKPVAVDPAGVRAVLEAGKLAQARKLGVAAGTQFRHHAGYREMMKRIHDGQIGRILRVRSIRLGGELWKFERRPGESDMEWQIRNWYYFGWLSGDFVVEMHVHQLDLVTWALRGHPHRATAAGGREVRTGEIHGNIYDHIAIDYEFPGGVHATHIGRQMEKTHHHTGVYVQGELGTADLHKLAISGQNPWKFEGQARNAYEQEHADLIESVRASNPINETETVAESTMTAILGREAAYTGRALEWDALLSSGLDLVPKVFAFGPLPVRPVPMPGQPRA